MRYGIFWGLMAGFTNLLPTGNIHGNLTLALDDGYPPGLFERSPEFAPKASHASRCSPMPLSARHFAASNAFRRCLIRSRLK
jgi:hypothetical protein